LVSETLNLAWHEV